MTRARASTAALLGLVAMGRLAFPPQALAASASVLLVPMCGETALRALTIPGRKPARNSTPANPSSCCLICHGSDRKRIGAACCDDDEGGDDDA